MPEGDTVAGHVLRLSPILVGHEVQKVYGTSASVRAGSRRLVGETVDDVRAIGKNLVVDFGSGYSLRVHLGMNGGWRILSPNRDVPGSAKVALSTSLGHAVCMGAPVAEVGRTPSIDVKLSRLGPDVLGPGFDPAEFADRARLRGESIIAEVLLDQRVAAGIGNVYKSELLFIIGVHPETPVSQVPLDSLAAMGERAARLLAFNVGPVPRSTTGERAEARRTFVYGRDGKPCRRCGSAIRRARHGARLTFWCPTCQPPG